MKIFFYILIYLAFFSVISAILIIYKNRSYFKAQIKNTENKMNNLHTDKGFKNEHN